MAKELKEGMYIAQGPETNILIRLVGKAPLLTVVGAIDLNRFYQKGVTVALAKDSIEVLDILSCPEKYRFESPAITTAIEKAGMDKTSGRSLNDIKDEEQSEFLNKFQEFIGLYGNCDKAENMFILWLKREKNIAISQGRFVIDQLYKLIQNV